MAIEVMSQANDRDQGGRFRKKSVEIRSSNFRPVQEILDQCSGDLSHCAVI
jgi:hypothetical protein